MAGGHRPPATGDAAGFSTAASIPQPTQLPNRRTSSRCCQRQAVAMNRSNRRSTCVLVPFVVRRKLKKPPPETEGGFSYSAARKIQALNRQARPSRPARGRLRRSDRRATWLRMAGSVLSTKGHVNAKFERSPRHRSSKMAEALATEHEIGSRISVLRQRHSLFV